MKQAMRAFAAGVLLLLSQPVWAQAEMKQAERYYNDLAYALALKSYQAVLEDQEPSLHVVQRIADCYRFMNNSKAAAFWYKQVLSFPGHEPLNLFYYAEAAKRNGNYQKARQLFLEYGRIEEQKKSLALKLAASCDTAMAWLAMPLPYEVKDLKNLNSKSADFSPVHFKKGVIFTSDRLRGGKNEKTYDWTGNGYLQLYYADKLNDSTWAKPVALNAPLNTRFHNGPAAVLESKNLIFVTRTYSVKKHSGKKNIDPTSWSFNPTDSKYVNRLKLYTAQMQKDRWVNVRPFAYNSNAYSVGHPAITADGNTLYFVSDMPGGFGETDIYYSEKSENGFWRKPVNAGPAINTPAKESFPSIAPDGTLYFSSDGHLGMGGLDIFKALGAHKKWSGVENLKYPVNSSRDDFGILFEESAEAGYLSSGRSNSQDNSLDNIFRFGRKKNVPIPVPGILKGRSVEHALVKGTARKKEIPLAGIKLELFRPDIKQAQTVYSDQDGTFSFKLEKGIQYVLRGSKTGYLNQSEEVLLTPSQADTMKVMLAFNRDTPNKPIVLENIYYDVDKFDIRPDAARELDKVVKMMADNPGISIELSSHTDSRQSHGYNMFLSELRAKAAVEYIVSRGAAPDRIVAKGYGKTKLLNRCSDGVRCSEAEHRENRRTEFKIISQSAGR